MKRRQLRFNKHGGSNYYKKEEQKRQNMNLILSKRPASTIQQIFSLFLYPPPRHYNKKFV